MYDIKNENIKSCHSQLIESTLPGRLFKKIMDNEMYFLLIVPLTPSFYLKYFVYFNFKPFFPICQGNFTVLEGIS